MTDTTIPVSNAVKAQIDEIKEEGETFNRTLQRLIDNYESDGQMWTEQEIRALCRDELEQHARR